MESNPGHLQRPLLTSFWLSHLAIYPRYIYIYIHIYIYHFVNCIQFIKNTKIYIFELILKLIHGCDGIYLTIGTFRLCMYLGYTLHIHVINNFLEYLQ